MTMNIGRQNSRRRGIADKELTGEVVDDNDPEKAERVKVRIKGVHDDISDEDLPWTGGTKNGVPANGKTTGSVGPIPKKGTSVNVSYPDDTQYFGSYTGTSTGTKHQPEELVGGKDQTGNDYPNVTATIDTAGNRMTSNAKRGTWDYEHISGTHVSFDGKGAISITVADNKVEGDHQDRSSKGLRFIVQGDVNIQATGNANIGCKGDANIMASGSMNIGADGDVNIAAKGDINMDGATINQNSGKARVPKLPAPSAPTPRSTPKPSSE